jgi:preprotein translocase subunit SecD
LPNFVSKETLARFPSFLPTRQMPLGLDLQGGAHLLLAIDQKELRTDWLNNLREDARKTLREAKIGFQAIGVSGDAVQVRLVKPEETDTALKALRKLVQPIGNMILGTSGNDSEVEKGNEPSKPSTGASTRWEPPSPRWCSRGAIACSCSIRDFRTRASSRS